MRSFLTGVAWPGMPSQRGSVLLSLLFQFERTQRWPAEQLLEHQLLQLTSLAQHACDTVPFYRERFDAASLRPADGLSLRPCARAGADAPRGPGRRSALWSGRVAPEPGTGGIQNGGSTGERSSAPATP